ncbi:MAG: diguanylate cyclase [Geminicoccaceae bacterium]|nr:diguanylate cyclase [Geminicoccaceae bacterium]
MAEDYLAHLQKAAEAALASMRRHAVPPNAVHYAVWFAHHAGHSPALSRAIQALEASGDAFDEVRHLELAERFLGRGAQLERIQALVGRADGALQAVAREIGGFRADTAAYGATLEGAASTIAGAARIEELARLVEALRHATTSMHSRAESLERELARRDAELGTLRGELARAEEAMSSDPLTGIANRRLFDRSLKAMAAAAVQQGEPLSLLMIDIDHFKKFNDTHGHQVGDLVLKLVASKLAEKASPPRLAARYGGEEFAILMPGSDLEAGLLLAEQLRREIATREVLLKTDGKRLGVVTLSIGVATFRPGESLEAFVTRADSALYRAKHAGRNRVEAETGAVVAAGAA